MCENKQGCTNAKDILFNGTIYTTKNISPVNVGIESVKKNCINVMTELIVSDKCLKPILFPDVPSLRGPPPGRHMLLSPKQAKIHKL